MRTWAASGSRAASGAEKRSVRSVAHVRCQRWSARGPEFVTCKLGWSGVQHIYATHCKGIS